MYIDNWPEFLRDATTPPPLGATIDPRTPLMRLPASSPWGFWRPRRFLCRFFTLTFGPEIAAARGSFFIVAHRAPRRVPCDASREKSEGTGASFSQGTRLEWGWGGWGSSMVLGRCWAAPGKNGYRVGVRFKLPALFSNLVLTQRL